MGKRILVVDDEPYIRSLLEQVLEDFTKAGVELFVAKSGPEAWDLIRSKRPDLVVLDVMLPGISGYEICQRTKSNPDLASIYIIMLTARGQAIDKQRGLDAGVDEYLTKPFDPKYLVKRVAEALAFTL